VVSTPSSVIAALGVPKVDAGDPGAALLATTSGTPTAQLEQALQLAADGAHRRGGSVEVCLRLVRASLELGNVGDARKRLVDLAAKIDGDWRLQWYAGQCELLEGNLAQASADFDVVLTMLPGELDPKLALAAIAELRKANAEAARYYATVWQTNHTYYSAAFGLARQLARVGDRAGAIATLDQITPASAHFAAAATTAIDVLLDDCTPADLDEAKLLNAGGRASELKLESATRRATIRLKVFSAALAWLQAGNTPRIGQLFGADFSVPGIRAGMELCYRALARETTDIWERIALVEEANAIRPRTRV
jgi:serine/threonine-protein kinase PknG